MSYWERIFGPSKTPSQLCKEYRRAIERSTRALDRECVKLHEQERRTLLEVKSLATRGQVSAAKSTARQVVVIRSALNKFYALKTRMMGVSIKMQTIGTSQELLMAMQGLSKVVMQVNKKFNLPEMKKITEDFAKQMDTLELKEDMMGDVVDGMDDDEIDGETEDTLVDQIMDEINLVKDLNVIHTGFKVPVTKTSIGNK